MESARAGGGPNSVIPPPGGGRSPERSDRRWGGPWTHEIESSGIETRSSRLRSSSNLHQRDQRSGQRTQDRKIDDKALYSNGCVGCAGRVGTDLQTPKSSKFQEHGGECFSAKILFGGLELRRLIRLLVRRSPRFGRADLDSAGRASRRQPEIDKQRGRKRD
jgi:hypothetical protein